MTMPSVSISLAFGINWITLACTTSLKQNTGRDIHYERQTISEKSTARAPAEPFGGIGTCTIFDRHRDLPPSHFLYRFGLDCGCSLLSDGLFFHQERAVANGSLMMCEVQGAKEDFIRRWNTIFKEYPDVFEDSDCRKIIHDLTEDAVQYLLKIKEKTL